MLNDIPIQESKTKSTLHRIADVLEHSPADNAGIRTGDYLSTINNQQMVDIFDYYYFSNDEKLNVNIIRENNNENKDFPEKQELCFTIHKDPDEDLGLLFEQALLDDYKHCSNRCIFCFIDQMPKGMRETLYFKDDDTRLSFLQGNYVTLTNLKDEDLERIIAYRLAPINISVHATDPDVRTFMLKNRFAGNILEKMRRIADADLPMNAQIVLCKGINDGQVLDKTLEDLAGLMPQLSSVSIVPVGLTKYREHLPALEPFTKEDALVVLDQIHAFSDRCRRLHGIGFAYASDEWYLEANQALPEEADYDGYPQLENGVGMARLLISEFTEALAFEKKRFWMRKKEVSIVCGTLIEPIIRKLCDDLTSKFSSVTVHIYPIRNDFFGEQVTVTGLLTGGDVMRQLEGKALGKKLLLPLNMLRSGEDVFLDDVHVSDVEQKLNVPIDIVASDGADLVKKILY